MGSPRCAPGAPRSLPAAQSAQVGQLLHPGSAALRSRRAFRLANAPACSAASMTAIPPFMSAVPGPAQCIAFPPRRLEWMRGGKDGVVMASQRDPDQCIRAAHAHARLKNRTQYEWSRRRHGMRCERLQRDVLRLPAAPTSRPSAVGACAQTREFERSRIDRRPRLLSARNERRFALRIQRFQQRLYACAPERGVACSLIDIWPELAHAAGKSKQARLWPGAVASFWPREAGDQRKLIVTAVRQFRGSRTPSRVGGRDRLRRGLGLGSEPAPMPRATRASRTTEARRSDRPGCRSANLTYRCGRRRQ